MTAFCRQFLRRAGGIVRRSTRGRIQRRIARGAARPAPGKRRLPGYGLEIAFPDEVIWAHQFMEILAQDGYKAGPLCGRPVVIDGGANIGMFSCWVKWLRPRAAITAVEPHQANVPYLRRNLAQLPAPAVDVRHAALGRAGTVGMQGCASDSMRTTRSEDGDVATVPLADLIRAPVDLLKLDVEGAELDALLSAGDKLRRVRRVVLEYHQFCDTTLRLSELIGLLENHGFDRFDLSDQRNVSWNDPDLPQYCCLLEASRSGRRQMANIEHRT